MNKAYCGKNCETCTERISLDCSGCREESGRSLHFDDCEITKCCVAKNHADCSTCTSFANCQLRLGCHDVPEARRQLAQRKAESDRWLAQHAAEIGKWVWGMFVVLMVGQVVGLLNLEFVQENFPAIAMFSRIATSVLSLLLALYLLQLGKFKAGFRTAGWCTLVSAAAGAVMNWVSNDILTIVVGIPVIVVGLVAAWYEYNAFGDLLQDADPEQSEKWRKLFKWEIGTLLGIFGCLLIVFILPWVGLIALLADAIAIIVVQILYYVYIYRTANLFKEYNP